MCKERVRKSLEIHCSKKENELFHNLEIFKILTTSPTCFVIVFYRSKKNKKGKEDQDGFENHDFLFQSYFQTFWQNNTTKKNTIKSVGESD